MTLESVGYVEESIETAEALVQYLRKWKFLCPLYRR